jgi:hypothetical protein
MNIPVIDESEVYESEIDTFVHAGVVVHHIKFESLSVRLEGEEMDKGLISEDRLEELE